MKNSAFTLNCRTNSQLIELPIHWGQDKKGVTKGSQLLSANVYGDLSQLFHHVYFKTYPGHSNPLNEIRYGDLYEYCQLAACRQTFNLFIGGDHSVSLATIPAMMEKHKNLKVIWVDAHGDINTPYTSPSGNIHGMPVAHLIGEIQGPHKFHWLKNYLDPKNIVYIGVRDLDPGEVSIIKDRGIKCFTAQDCYQLGMSTVMKKTLEHFQEPYGLPSPIHLSFDIDSVDPILAPATGVPVKGGLCYTQIEQLGQCLGHTQQIVSADFVEFNPELATDKRSLARTMLIFSGLLSAIFSGYNLPHGIFQKSKVYFSRVSQAQLTH